MIFIIIFTSIIGGILGTFLAHKFIIPFIEKILKAVSLKKNTRIFPSLIVEKK